MIFACRREYLTVRTESDTGNSADVSAYDELLPGPGELPDLNGGGSPPRPTRDLPSWLKRTAQALPQALSCFNVATSRFVAISTVGRAPLAHPQVPPTFRPG